MAVGVVLGVLGAFLLIAVLFYALSSSRNARGDRRAEDSAREGEERLSRYVERALSDCPERLLLNNLILPGIHEERRTTEIDTLAISRKGVFVIETKSWNGIVRGSEEEERWAVHYPSGRSHDFYNPVWQNRGHLRRVLSLIQSRTDLPIGKIPLVPLVVFLGGDISEVEEESCCTPREAVERIQASPKRLSLEEVEALKSLFLGFKEHPPVSKEEHVAYVKALHGKEEEEDC